MKVFPKAVYLLVMLHTLSKVYLLNALLMCMMAVIKPSIGQIAAVIAAPLQLTASFWKLFQIVSCQILGAKFGFSTQAKGVRTRMF